MNGRTRAWRLLVWSAILLVPLMLGACATRGGAADDPTPDDATEAAAPQPGEGAATGQAMGQGQGQGQGQVDCSTVRCAACPEGQTPALKPPNCCRCVPRRNTLVSAATSIGSPSAVAVPCASI